MTLVLACALTATAGLALVWCAVTPRRASLRAELDALLASESVPHATSPDFWTSLGDAFVSMIRRDEPRSARFLRDLETSGDTPASFVRQILTTAIVLGALALATLGALDAEGIHLGAGVGITILLAATVLGAALPRITLRSQAMERRAEMREVVAVICDLAAVLVAAGEDIDGAVVAASGAGTGWAFEAVRQSLPLSGRQGTWVALERLGERIGVDELVILAQNMGLAEERGAKVREALNTQAKALREEAAAEMEARAGSMTERMSFPMVMLLAGFLLAIGYPAVARL